MPLLYHYLLVSMDFLFPLLTQVKINIDSQNVYSNPKDALSNDTAISNNFQIITNNIVCFNFKVKKLNEKVLAWATAQRDKKSSAVIK